MFSFKFLMLLNSYFIMSFKLSPDYGTYVTTGDSAVQLNIRLMRRLSNSVAFVAGFPAC